MPESEDAADLEFEEEELEEYRVSPLELFFDLVFVFALTQVTALVAADLSWLGLLRGLAVLIAVWWSWVGYAWLTNTVPIDENDWARVVMFAAMTAMLIVAMAIPTAFSAHGVLFGIAYLIVTMLFLMLYLVTTHDRPDLHQAIHRLAPVAVLAPILIAVAGFFDPGPLRASLWALALAILLGAGYLAGTSSWQVRPGYFAERHGLIIIIALGESMVALGVATSHGEVTPLLITCAALGVTVISGLWWLYFDVVSYVGELRLRRLHGRERNALARDAYSYIHLLIVTGIVMVALGLKKVLVSEQHPLTVVAAVVLFGGVALYLVGHTLFRWRSIHSLNRKRIIAAVLLVVLIPVGTLVAAWAALALVAVVMVGLVVYEVVRFRELRAWIRANH